MRDYLYKDLFDKEKKHWWHVAKRGVEEALIKKFLNVNDARILDVGCGTGQSLLMLQKFGSVVGIDNSKEAIKFCQKRNIKNIKLADAERTGFTSSDFDLVTILDVLEHTNDSKVLREAHRILKKEGLLLLTVPAFPWLWSKWDEVLGHKRRYTRKSLSTLLKKNSFEIVKLSYMHSFLILPVLLIRSLKSLFVKEYGSDFEINNPFFNALLSILAALERPFIILGLVPFGTSLVTVAKKI